MKATLEFNMPEDQVEFDFEGYQLKDDCWVWSEEIY